jgi:ubiquinone/menaquinone biosynthesis C-methylase UbiE
VQSVSLNLKALCKAPVVARLLDPEGTHVAAVLRTADFRGCRVLEVGCGDGRLTWGIAPLAASVLAFDPAEESVDTARRACPAALRDKVRFEVAQAEEINVPPHSVDLVFFSWSL